MHARVDLAVFALHIVERTEFLTFLNKFVAQGNHLIEVPIRHHLLALGRIFDRYLRLQIAHNFHIVWIKRIDLNTRDDRREIGL